MNESPSFEASPPKSAVYSINSNGPRTDPCGTPCESLRTDDLPPSNITASVKHHYLSATSWIGTYPVKRRGTIAPTRRSLPPSYLEPLYAIQAAGEDRERSTDGPSH